MLAQSQPEERDLRNVALSLGMSENAIYVMKITQRPRYDYINNLVPGDFKASHIIYEQ